MSTCVLDEEVDGDIGEDLVGDFHVENVRRRRVDDLFARLLGAHGVAARRRRTLGHVRVLVAEVGRCRVDGRGG